MDLRWQHNDVSLHVLLKIDSFGVNLSFMTIQFNLISLNLKLIVQNRIREIPLAAATNYAVLKRRENLSLLS